MQARGPVFAGIAQGLRSEAEEPGVALGEEYLASGHVPIPQAIARGIQRQAQTLLVTGQFQACAAVLQGIAVQHQVEQRTGERDEQQALEGLRVLLLRHGQAQGGQQMVAEKNPQSGEQEVAQGQTQGGDVDTHGQAAVLPVNAGQYICFTAETFSSKRPPGFLAWVRDNVIRFVLAGQAAFPPFKRQQRPCGTTVYSTCRSGNWWQSLC